ncbi:MAG: hypothetical protein Kow0054_21670 [Deferrisoma sp.]
MDAAPTLKPDSGVTVLLRGGPKGALGRFQALSARTLEGLDAKKLGGQDAKVLRDSIITGCPPCGCGSRAAPPSP